MHGKVDEEVGRAGERQRQVAEVCHVRDPAGPADRLGAEVLKSFWLQNLIIVKSPNFSPILLE